MRIVPVISYCLVVGLVLVELLFLTVGRLEFRGLVRGGYHNTMEVIVKYSTVHYSAVS